MREEIYQREIIILRERIKNIQAVIDNIQSKKWPDFTEWLKEISEKIKEPQFPIGTMKVLKKIYNVNADMFRRITH